MRVLVTGGTSGLGLAMATALAAAGSAVALTGRSGDAGEQRRDRDEHGQPALHDGAAAVLGDAD